MTGTANLGGPRRTVVEPLLQVAIFFVTCFPLVRPVSAQVFDTGTIAGLVTDPSGAAVPHATITITNVGTSIERTLQTDQGGNFVSSALPSGNYVVSAKIGRASCRERV